MLDTVHVSLNVDDRMCLAVRLEMLLQGTSQGSEAAIDDTANLVVIEHPPRDLDILLVKLFAAVDASGNNGPL